VGRVAQAGQWFAKKFLGQVVDFNLLACLGPLLIIRSPCGKSVGRGGLVITRITLKCRQKKLYIHIFFM